MGGPAAEADATGLLPRAAAAAAGSVKWVLLRSQNQEERAQPSLTPRQLSARVFSELETPPVYNPTPYMNSPPALSRGGKQCYLYPQPPHEIPFLSGSFWS